MENNSSQQYNKANQEDIIDLRAVVMKYVKKWYWFVLSGFLCLAVAVIYVIRAIPQYSVQTTILLRNENTTNPLAELAMLGSLDGTSKEVEDEMQILSSQTLMREMVRTLGLETEYSAKKGFFKYREQYPVSDLRLTPPSTAFNDTLTATLTFDIRRAKDGYTVRFEARDFKEKYELADLSAPFTTPYGEMRFTEVRPLDEDMKYHIVSRPTRVQVERCATAITVGTVNKKSNAIRLSTISGTPGKAVNMLNRLVELYNQDAVNDKNLIGVSTSKFVDAQIASVETELSQIETEIEKYKQANQLTDISAEAQIFLESMSEYDKLLLDIETQINLVNYIATYVQNEENKYSPVPANLGISDPSLVALIKEYNDFLFQRMRLTRTANDQNVAMLELETTLSAIRKSIITSIESISDGLDISKADLMSKSSQFTSRMQDVPRQEREYLEMMRRQEVSQKLYVFLLQKKKENELTMATALPAAKVIDSAYASLDPVSPRKMIILFVALMLGVAIPMVAIYLLALLNDKIQDKKEFQRLVRVPYIGSVSLNKSADRIVVREGKITPIAEMFRNIRTNLQFMLGGKEHPVILVTSSVSGEGKSFISSNLAMSFALMNKKVVLLGMDIRNPMLGEYLHMPKERFGITMYLSDPSVKVSEIIHTVDDLPNFSLIQSGPVPPNPAELLMNPRLGELIAELKQTYDYIIIDSAPVGIVSDTFLISKYTDNTVYVSRQGYTSREVTGLINELYQEKKLKNMAVVLNGTDEAATYYGYNHKKYMKI